MDPVSALGAAAAGAQFVGLAVKTLLGAVKLFQGIKEDPQRAVELLTWIEEELNSMQRLLHPESPVFASLTTSQYVQIAPSAINARKALDKVRTVLSPLVQDIDRLKARDNSGRKIVLLWKSLFTMKMMKDVENNLETIRMLNATLLRELQICGFETQSLLRDQSIQVLSMVVELSKRDDELLKSMKQLITLQEQNLEEARQSRNALSEYLRQYQVIENDRYQELLRTGTTNFHAVQNMPRLEIITADSQTEMATVKGLESNNISLNLGTTDNIQHGLIGKSSRSLRCKCHSNKFSSVSDIRLFSFKTARQVFQFCPKHGWIGCQIYSIEANLRPWLYGSLRISLGVLLRGRTWSIPPPLQFQGTVQRSKSRIFTLIDAFISSCLGEELPENLSELRLLEGRLFKVQPARDMRKVKDGLQYVLRGIKEATTAGDASCSDMDEEGLTLLSDLTMIFGCLGTEILAVETEILQLLQIAYDANLDPSRHFEIDWCTIRRDLHCPRMTFSPTVGQAILHFAAHAGKISTSLYQAFMDYDGLVESAAKDTPKLLSPPSVGYWKAITSDLFLAEGMGYSDLSLTIISRSLEGLAEHVDPIPGMNAPMDERLSPFDLALGWSEGLQLLLDSLLDKDHSNLCAIHNAFKLACQLHDYKSASLLLSASRRNNTSDALVHFFIQDPDTLTAIQQDIAIFRLFAVELKEHYAIWSMGAWIHSCSHSCMSIGSENDQATLGPKDAWARGLPNCRSGFASSFLHSANGREAMKAQHHQVLFDLGFTNVDTVCGPEGTPLGYKCHLQLQRRSAWARLLPEESTSWCAAVLWLLKRGANPRITTPNSRLDGKYVHHFLALAQEDGVKLDRCFLKVLGRQNERYMHDNCWCLCSSAGCIPSLSFWRRDIVMPDGGKAYRYGLTNRILHVRRWIHYWRHSGTDKEFIYHELCRYEIFERLGMTHLCCAADSAIRDQREHIELEDENSAQDLEYILLFYLRLRKEYSKISIEVFWNFWWDNMDALLPPLKALTSQWRYGSRLGEPIFAQNDLQNDLDISRDRKWRATLEEAGYKDWDYQDIIRDHCTKILLKARAHRQRVAAWKQHRLVSKPRFGRRQPLKFLRKEPEDDWEP